MNSVLIRYQQFSLIGVKMVKLGPSSGEIERNTSKPLVMFLVIFNLCLNPKLNSIKVFDLLGFSSHLRSMGRDV